LFWRIVTGPEAVRQTVSFLPVASAWVAEDVPVAHLMIAPSRPHADHHSGRLLLSEGFFNCEDLCGVFAHPA
jgi:hypothetical protein